MTEPQRQIVHPPEWPRYDEATVQRAAELVRHGRTFDYKYGAELAALENRFAALHPGRQALAVNSGTSALLAAYRVLDIGPGDEVVVPTMTFLATASPLLLLGATPVLCDSAAPTGNVTAETIEPRLTRRTRAITVTHLFGHPCPMDEIIELAGEHGIPVIEDCSHAHGSTYHGRPVGTFGDLAVFSIGGLKIVSGGMGGILLSKDRRHHDLAILLSSFQQRSELTVADPGLRGLADFGLGCNLRISPVAAVLADSHLVRLPELVAAKHRNISALVEALSSHEGVSGIPVGADCTMGGWYDAIVAVDPERAGFTRDELIAALQAEGVRARIPRTAPLHTASVFRGEPAAAALLRHGTPGRSDLRYDRAALPQSIDLHRRWVSLPATFFNDPAGALVQPYLNGIAAALERLDSDAGRKTRVTSGYSSLC